jgi:hypothetical protein
VAIAARMRAVCGSSGSWWSAHRQISQQRWLVLVTGAQVIAAMLDRFPLLARW